MIWIRLMALSTRRAEPRRSLPPKLLLDNHPACFRCNGGESARLEHPGDVGSDVKGSRTGRRQSGSLSECVSGQQACNEDRSSFRQVAHDDIRIGTT